MARRDSGSRARDTPHGGGADGRAAPGGGAERDDEVAPDGETARDAALRTAAPPRRVAAVDLPAFPLQLLLRTHPDWAGHPAAVVAEDRPQGLVLWVNEEARRLQVLPGMRYAAARSLADGLRAAPVPGDVIERAVDDAAVRLRRFTPSVEPDRDDPGLFLLDASGLDRLFPDGRAWAESIADDLAAAGLDARIAVGFTPFGVHATAKALSSARPSSRHPPGPSARGAARRVVVFPDAAAERATLRRVPLDRLGIDPAARDLLAKLGARTVADFLALPADGLGTRFGDAVRRLHRRATGEVRDPLRPEPEPEPVRETALLETPEPDLLRILFLAKAMTDRLLERLAARREALAALDVRMRVERRVGSPDPGDVHTSVRTAAPTLDAAQVTDLLHLRLTALRPAAGVTEFELTAVGAPAAPEQLRLFAETPRRDLAAAARALARLRAEFGEDAVVRARLRDAHLPEASFVWEPLERLPLPRPRAAAEPPLVRRLRARPEALPPRPRHEPDGWLLRGLEHGPVVKFAGPYVTAGGWWAGDEVRRETHYAETGRGRLFWVFYDVRRRRWFLQGEVS